MPTNIGFIQPEQQAEFLTAQLCEACDLYNCAFEERRSAWKYCHISLNYYDQANQLKAMRAQGLIGLANYSSCQDVLRAIGQDLSGLLRAIEVRREGGISAFSFPPAIRQGCVPVLR